MLEAKHGIRFGGSARGIIVVFAVAIALCAPTLAFADEPDDSFDSASNPSIAAAQVDAATADDAEAVIEEDADDEADASDGEIDAGAEQADPADVGDGTGDDFDSPAAGNEEAEGDIPQSGEAADPSDEGDDQDDAIADIVTDAEYYFGDASASCEFTAKGLGCGISPNETPAAEPAAADEAAPAAPNGDDAAIAAAPQEANAETELPESEEPKAKEAEAEESEDALITCTDTATQPAFVAPVIQADESAYEAEGESDDSKPAPPLQPDLPMPFESGGPTAPQNTLSSQMRSMGDTEQPDCLATLDEAESSSFRLTATKVLSSKAPRSIAPCLGQYRCRSPNAPSAL